MNSCCGLSRSESCAASASNSSLRAMSTLLSDDHQRLLGAFEPGEHRLDPLAELGRGVDHQQDQVGVLGPGPGGGDHRPVEPAARRENARRVDQQDLRVAVDRDAHQPRARGLRLGADDRDLLPDQRIDQGRLAGVGRADHRDEARSAGSLQLLQQRRRRRRFRLPACSSLRRSLRRALPTATRTVNRGAWCAPVRATIS